MATDKGVATVKPTKAAPAPRPQAPPRPASDASGQRVMKYLHEVQTELRKTSWPTKAEVIAQTQVVLGLLVVVGVFIAGWDFILGQIFHALMWLLGVRNGL